MASTAVELLVAIDPSNAHVLGSVCDQDDLLAAGIDSASLVELALRVEELLGVALPAADIDRLTTLAGITDVIDRRRGSQTDG